MQIICISRGTSEGGQELAERLAGMMNYTCLGREDLIEAATREGIQVGKLEMAMLKPHSFNERLARQRDYYIAFSRVYLCRRALEGDLVYHGRTGHLLLLGLDQILRVRVIAGLEHRIRNIMDRMGLEREKAVKYIQEVDQDRSNWVRAMYGVSIEEALNYDVTINLQQMNVTNAASALTAVAQLPDFQSTPASEKALQNLLLGSEARLALARDERTHTADLNVRADAGVVTVSYPPHDSGVADAIPDVLESVPGISTFSVTMAATNLLWIEEEFEPGSENFGNVVEIATKWNAAVELVRFTCDSDTEGEECPAQDTMVASPPTAAAEYNGGIEDDEPESDADDGGLKKTIDALARQGRSGGGRNIAGGQRRLVETLDRTIPYTLVVIGDLFLSVGHAARQRAIRDLHGYLSDRIRVPVVTSDELGKQYLFRPRDAFKAGGYLALVAFLFLLVFTNQETILAFLANTGWYAEAVQGTFLSSIEWLPRLLVAVAVFLVIPLVAFSYGKVTSTLLKLIKME